MEFKDTYIHKIDPKCQLNFFYWKDDVHVKIKFKVNDEVLLKILTFFIFAQNELSHKHYVANKLSRFSYNPPLEKGTTVHLNKLEFLSPKMLVTQYSFCWFFAILLLYISFPMERDKTLQGQDHSVKNNGTHGDVLSQEVFM